MYDWNDFLNLAFNILDDKSDNIKNETKYRIAISRAYMQHFIKLSFFIVADKNLKIFIAEAKDYMKRFAINLLM